LGYEILHTNIEGALESLGFEYEAFDNERTTVPQSYHYLSWLKSQLVHGHGVVWFIMCKGDEHNAYNLPHATYDHIEAVYGIWSNYSLSDGNVHPDDVLVHTSGYAPDGSANTGYHRRFDSLIDTTDMNGNCSAAQPEWRRNEAYPCLEENYSFGYSIKGNKHGEGKPVVLQMSSYEEPNIRNGTPAVNLTGTVTCSKLTPGLKYGLYRFNTGNAGVPKNYHEYWIYADVALYFVAQSETFTYEDPEPILSSSIVAYRCAGTLYAEGDPAETPSFLAQ
jgi:hypothetical protein